MGGGWEPFGCYSLRCLEPSLQELPVHSRATAAIPLHDHSNIRTEHYVVEEGRAKVVELLDTVSELEAALKLLEGR